MIMFIRSLAEIVSNATLSGAICVVTADRRNDGRACVAGILEVDEENRNRVVRSEAEQPALELQRVQRGTDRMWDQERFEGIEVDETDLRGVNRAQLRRRRRG